MIRDAKIGIWGPRGAGKTTYLVSLYFEMANIDTNTWKTTPDNHTRDFLSTAESFINRNNFPSATDIGELLVIDFEYTKDNFFHRHKRYHLELFDSSGLLVDGKTDEVGTLRGEYHNYLRECDGILMIVDPDWPHHESTKLTYYSLLKTFFNEVWDQNSPNNPYLAFCVTKIDIEKHWKHRNNIKDYFRTVISESANLLINENCKSDQYQIFAVSAAGRYVTPLGFERSNVISTMEGYKLANSSERRPHNISKPLLWLFNCIDKNTLSYWDRFGRVPPNAE